MRRGWDASAPASTARITNAITATARCLFRIGPYARGDRSGFAKPLQRWMGARWHHGAGRVRRRTPLLLDLGIATMVLTPGETVRKQAIARFRLRPERVVAVPEAAAHWFRPVDAPPAAAPYFLFVGTLEP